VVARREVFVPERLADPLCRCFDIDPETVAWSSQRPHVPIEMNAGIPDGMAIDEEDGLWVALWGGTAVSHNYRTRRLVEIIRVPGVSQVSSCAFGGGDGSVLYVTTSRQGLPQDCEPDAGAACALSTGTRGATLFDFCS